MIWHTASPGRDSYPDQSNKSLFKWYCLDAIWIIKIIYQWKQPWTGQLLELNNILTTTDKPFWL